MGNLLTNPHRLSAAARTGKVVLSDGTVQEFDKPLTVAELMLEHPQQMVIEFPMNLNERRAAPLPADQKLEMNRVYVMIPVRRGKPAASLISSEEARRILLQAHTLLKSRSNLLSSYGGFLPVFGRMCAAGMGGKSENQAGRNKKLQYGGGGEETKSSVEECFSEMVEERPEFLSRQISGKGWKPSLDTITEKTIHAKVRHWLF